MAKILDWDGLTRHDIDPGKVLKAAIGELESVLVIGWDKEGELYTASSKSDGGDILWLLEKCKQRLMN